MELPLRLAVARTHLAVGRRGAAARGVDEALAMIERRAVRIPEPSLRVRFFTDVPENAALVALGRELGVSGRDQAEV